MKDVSDHESWESKATNDMPLHTQNDGINQNNQKNNQLLCAGEDVEKLEWQMAQAL